MEWSNNLVGFSAVPVLNKLTAALGLAIGIYSVVYGSIAKTFSFRSRSFTFEEPSRFVPKWQDRALVVFGGLCLVGFSLLQLLRSLRHP